MWCMKLVIFLLLNVLDSDSIGIVWCILVKWLEGCVLICWVGLLVWVSFGCLCFSVFSLCIIWLQLMLVIFGVFSLWQVWLVWVICWWRFLVCLVGLGFIGIWWFWDGWGFYCVWLLGFVMFCFCSVKLCLMGVFLFWWM